MPNENNKFDKTLYDAMDTETLQEILREDASKTEGEESNQAEIMYVMEVLAERRKMQNQGKSPDEAWESFQRYCEEHENDDISEREKGQACGWTKRMAAAAAVVVLLLGGMVTAQGFGVDLWQTIAKWTQETFFLGYLGQTEPSMGAETDYVNPCASLQASLDEFKTELKLVPTWLPEGYAETDVTVTQTPTQRRFIAKYESDAGSIQIRIADYLGGHPSEIEQSEAVVEVYEVGGVPYYIFNNYDQIKAVWINENFESYIMGPVSVSEMKQIIDSIEKG